MYSNTNNIHNLKLKCVYIVKQISLSSSNEKQERSIIPELLMTLHFSVKVKKSES